METGIDKINGYDYVDLGLPSGTLWASHDIGANGVGMLGSFFMWGETEARDENTEWNSEDHKYTSQSGDYIKYCEQDMKKVLDPMDDAATSLWSSNWRMPSLTDWKELARFCEIDVRDGQIVVAGPNGNEMILPIYSHNKFEGFDFSCSWWTSEADPDCYYDSFLFYFDKETDGEIDFDDICDCRDVLCAIRPVSKIRADLNFVLPEDDETEDDYSTESAEENSEGNSNSESDSYDELYKSVIDNLNNHYQSGNVSNSSSVKYEKNSSRKTTYTKDGYEKDKTSKVSYVLFAIAILILMLAFV